MEGDVEDQLLALDGYGWTGRDILNAGASPFQTVWYVNGTSGVGSDDYEGKNRTRPKATIQAAVTAAGQGDTILIEPKTITDYTGDPTSYAETVTITYAKTGLQLIGVSRGLTQGGLPQIKKGSGTTALLTIQAPGCRIMNLGFNGASSTGGGILLSDDYAATAAFGTTITGCHFKNCKKHATNGTLGGAIMWNSAGNSWQIRITNNVFYKNVADIVLLGTSNTVPQDVVIENNIFSGPAASVDVNLYLGGGSGINGLTIRRNTFVAFPAIGSGTNTKQLMLTGCVGILEGNHFGCTGKTFGAAGNNLVPTTMFLAGNYQEDAIITRT